MTGPGEALIATILFIPLSAAQFNLEADWAEAGMQVILRHCPICSHNSIVGHVEDIGSDFRKAFGPHSKFSDR